MVNTPFISPNSLRIALDSLLYSSSKKDVSLLSLLLVDEFLVQPDLPHSSLNREFALSQILTSLIVAEFTHHRMMAGYQIPNSDTSRESALEMIHYDVESRSPELVGWSWLYHHYVRVDFDIQVETFCNILHIEERTLRRYQQHILKKLTSLLIEHEWSARIRQRHRRLLSELPRAANFEFLELRTDVSNYVSQMLIKTKPAHFFIRGARGVGKTAFVEHIIRNQILEEQVDQLVWVQMPASSQYIYHYLVERLLIPETQIELREYLLLHRTIIVLDDIELLFNDLSQLRSVLHILSPAVVFMTCSSAYSVMPDTIEVTLQEFTKDDAQVFAEHVLASTKHAALINGDKVASIWNRVGGNPLVLQMVIRNLPYFDLRSIDNLLGLNAIYNQIFQLLNENAQLAWIIFVFYPSGMIEFNTLQQLWPEHITRDTVGNLLQYHIIETSSALMQFHLVNGARRYIMDGYQQDAYIRKSTHRLLQQFDAFASHSVNIDYANPYLAQLEHLLLADWIEIDAHLRKKWIENWCIDGVRCKHWSAWRTLLEKQIEANTGDTKLFYNYAICLRHLGEWSLAQQMIEAAISEMGRNGLFLEQAEALLQLSIILRYQEEYKKAFEILARVGKIAIRYNSETLIPALSIEYIHLSIDLGDPQYAEANMISVPDSTQSYFLKSELYFLKHDYEQSRSYAESSLQYTNSNFPLRARIYTLIGRICERENNLEGAQENFSWALMILEQQDDLFALSRAQLNLGALFMQTGDYVEAGTLLNAAEKIQLRFRNQVTLAAIQHNLRLLDIALFK